MDPFQADPETSFPSRAPLSAVREGQGPFSTVTTFVSSENRSLSACSSQGRPRGQGEGHGQGKGQGEGEREGTRMGARLGSLKGLSGFGSPSSSRQKPSHAPSPDGPPTEPIFKGTVHQAPSSTPPSSSTTTTPSPPSSATSSRPAEHDESPSVPDGSLAPPPVTVVRSRTGKVVGMEAALFSQSGAWRDFEVWELPGLLSPEECQVLMQAGQGRWRRSRIQVRQIDAFCFCVSR